MTHGEKIRIDRRPTRTGRSSQGCIVTFLGWCVQFAPAMRVAPLRPTPLGEDYRHEHYSDRLASCAFPRYLGVWSVGGGGRVRSTRGAARRGNGPVLATGGTADGRRIPYPISGTPGNPRRCRQDYLRRSLSPTRLRPGEGGSPGLCPVPAVAIPAPSTT